MTDELKKTEDQKKQPAGRRLMGMWLAIGVAVGAGVGVATHNLAVWIGAGIAVGAAIGIIQTRQSK
jgi:hypothetical protein